ncbi:MAG: amidohydrolase family protein [Candidatus Binatia bacterium]
MKIDVHAHYVPESCLNDVEVKGADGRVHGIRIVQDGSRQVAYTGNARNFAFDPPQIYRIERRLSDMQDQFVDMQVFSVPPFLFFHATDPAKSLELCRKINDAFAETVRKYSNRFIALANLPMQDPEMAARELERSVRELGLRGAEICSNIDGKNLDDKSLAPFYRKLQELDVPVFIHPSNVLGGERLRRYHLGNLIGNPTDTAVAAASLIFAGVLKEFPRLKFYLAHGGGSCPFLRGRWEHGWRVRPEARTNIDRLPSEYFKLLYFNSLTHSVPALNFLVETVGVGRVMMGTDYPFDMSDKDPVRNIAALPHLSDDQKEMIFGGNAAAFFKIGSSFEK